jgi:iron complex transport system ATP-binding protein
VIAVQNLRAAAVSSATLSAPNGSVTALIGPNGAGKSTVLRAILGLVPSDGEVEIDGVDPRALPPEHRARRVAWVPQRTQLRGDLTGREVVGMGRFTHADGSVDTAIARVSAGDFADRRFGTLSGGEQQRVLLARALATEARNLLLDEPTSALDVRASLEILELLRDLSRDGVCVVAVLHSLGDAMRFADRAVLMEGGRTIAEGPCADVLDPTRVEAVYGVRVVPGHTFERSR